MSSQYRRILTPGASRKRKEREALFPTTSSKTLVPPTTVSRAVNLSNASTTSSKGAEQQSNRLLAGYMAYEYMTRGTLLGQKFDPTRAEAVPISAAEYKRKPHAAAEAEPSGKSEPQSYAELALLLKGDGAHIPGVVNPTQLARWIQM